MLITRWSIHLVRHLGEELLLYRIVLQVDALAILMQVKTVIGAKAEALVYKHTNKKVPQKGNTQKTSGVINMKGKYIYNMISLF